MKNSDVSCMGCYRELDLKTDVGGYHRSCSKKLFGTPVPPHVDFGMDQIEEMALESLNRHLGITGVQPKISLDLQKDSESPNHRLMIVGLWGELILKPPTKRLPDMSVVEDATMHMAEAAGITTARHGLIRLKSGELAYVTRRFDRRGKKEKVAVEDFCQLSGLLTERKYKTSMEKAGKIILQYSSNPGLDVVTFFDLALFSYLTGNADMHLKNFSLMTHENGDVTLAPAYDLLSTYLMPINDPEDCALPINGKKSKLRRGDFKEFGATLRIPPKAIENSFLRLSAAIPQMKEIADASFMKSELKKDFKDLLDSRAERLF